MKIKTYECQRHYGLEDHDGKKSTVLHNEYPAVFSRKSPVESFSYGYRREWAFRNHEKTNGEIFVVPSYFWFEYTEFRRFYD